MIPHSFLSTAHARHHWQQVRKKYKKEHDGEGKMHQNGKESVHVCVHKEWVEWVSISLEIVLYLYWCLFCWYKAPPLIMFPSSPPCPQPLSNAVAAIRFSRPLVTLNTLAGCSTLTAVQHMTCCMHNCGHNWHEMQHLQHHWFQTLSQGMWGAYPLEVMMIWTDLFSGDQGARARHYVSKMMVWASWHSPGLSTKHV